MKNIFTNRLAPAPIHGSFRMEGYIVWGASVIRGDDGRYYMYASRWPKSATMSNWIVNSEIVLASSDRPEGPFEFEKVILPVRGPQYWDGMVTHNPSIHRHHGKYVLFYVGSTYDFEMPKSKVSREIYGQVWNRKRIGVATSDSPLGPFVRLDEPVLKPRGGKWDAAITSNPAAVIHTDGSSLLIYKSAPVAYPERENNNALFLGVAKAPHYTDPYTRLNDGQKLQITGLGDARVEDPCIWYSDGCYHMIAKVFDRKFTGEEGAGFYACSDDGIAWKCPENPKAYSRTVRFSDGTTRTQHKLERPQVLIQNGKPTHIYFATADPEWADIYNLVIPLMEE